MVMAEKSKAYDRIDVDKIMTLMTPMIGKGQRPLQLMKIAADILEKIADDDDFAWVADNPEAALVLEHTFYTISRQIRQRMPQPVAAIREAFAPYDIQR
jgi:hypothetical protein